LWTVDMHTMAQIFAIMTGLALLGTTTVAG
jgi:hypothetical protein